MCNHIDLGNTEFLTQQQQIYQHLYTLCLRISAEAWVTYMLKWSFKYLVCEVIAWATSLGWVITHVLQDGCTAVKDYNTPKKLSAL